MGSGSLPALRIRGEKIVRPGSDTSRSLGLLAHTSLMTSALYFRSMSILCVLLAAVALSTVTAAQQATSFPTEDGGLISADLYGKGARGVVLAHGGRFTKESWR